MSEQIKPEESLRTKVEKKTIEDGAIRRAELWRQMGFPTSKPHMPQHEYDRDYVGRIWFVNEQALDQAQRALQIILCPGCLKEDKRGGISATRFYITIEDDVMTVFPAVGHFLCHFCGLEEWQPLKDDPRKEWQPLNLDATMLRQIELAQKQMQAQDARMQNQVRYRQLANQLGNQLGNPGVLPGMGIDGTRSEEQALRRLYENHMKNLPNAIANPPIINPLLGKKINKT